MGFEFKPKLSAVLAVLQGASDRNNSWTKPLQRETIVNGVDYFDLGMV